MSERPRESVERKPAGAGAGRAPRSPLRRLLRRFTVTDEEREAERLQHAAARAGYRLARECSRGDYATISGRLRSVVYTPRTGPPALEAELYDGSGTVLLVWLGRRHIAGIEPGRELTVRGRVATRDGEPVIYNPYYELRR